MSAPNPRKRAAPGASPLIPMQPQMPQQYSAPNLPGDQLVRWNGGDNMGGFVDGSANPADAFDLIPNGQQYSQNLAATNSLARRPTNRALVPTNNYDQWAYIPDDAALVPQQHDENVAEEDNIEELEERAARVKKEAQGKRKQIPPFVQKLSSFLEEGKNEDLIRWSQKGDSFIVLDEDEFANTLIPELFKHRNYASFVRQLNMYGFHKRVGLSDNSMRASERKNKSPSEYSNPYFRRGHPNLLWLINKPKSGDKKKDPQNKSPEEGDQDEVAQEEPRGQAQNPAAAHAPKSLPAPAETTSSGKEVAVIRDELKQLREQQKLISRTINQLQQNNRDLYNQAMLFQNQHDRHQNSINAILHFLANLFRKSLEEQGNSQSVSDILSSMLANQGQAQGQGQHGSVVDLGDYFANNSDPGLTGTPHRKARGLLPPIPDRDASRSTTRSPSAAQTPFHPMGGQNREMGQVTELADGFNADTPPNLRQELENNPQEQMMRIINDHNANSSSGLDLPEAADFVANAPNINQDQRNQLHNLISRQSATPTGTARSSATPNVPSHKSASSMRATVSPSPGPSGDGAPSLSPIMRSPAMPPLSINQINSNQNELDRLQELQQQQDARINEINGMLGPLSPSGRVPGLDEVPVDNSYFDANNLDLDQYFDSNALFSDPTFGGTNGEFNMNFENPDDMFVTNDQTNATSTAATNTRNHNTPSPAGTEEIQREDFDDQGNGTPTKRRRVG